MKIKLLATCCLMLFIAVATRWSSASVRTLGQTEKSPGAAGRLRQHVRMLSESLCPRDAAHPENLERTADYIGEQFAATGAGVSDQPFRAGGTTYRNVVASFGPERGERIVVGLRGGMVSVLFGVAGSGQTLVGVAPSAAGCGSEQPCPSR